MSEVGGPLESVDLDPDGDVLADGRFGLDDRHGRGCYGVRGATWL